MAMETLEDLEDSKENVSAEAYAISRKQILRSYSKICAAAAAFGPFDRCGRELQILEDDVSWEDFADFVDEDAAFERVPANDPMRNLLEDVNLHGLRVNEGALCIAWYDMERAWTTEIPVRELPVSDAAMRFRELCNCTEIVDVVKVFWILAKETLKTICFDDDEEIIVESVERVGDTLFA